MINSTKSLILADNDDDINNDNYNKNYLLIGNN